MCAYCKGVCPEPIIAVACGEDYLMYVEIEDGRLNVCDERFGAVIEEREEIKFCPMCGRDLGGDA